MNPIFTRPILNAYHHFMKKLLRIVFPLFALTCISTESEAQAPYLSSGPNGGIVHSFYRDITNTVYAAGSGGIYVSGDEGQSWQEASGSPTAFGCDVLYSVAASGNNLFAGSLQSGIYRSFDAGVSWIPSVTGLRVAQGAPYTDVEIAGANVLAVRADSGFLFISGDQGTTWVRHNLAIANASARYICIHNNIVYVNTLQGLFSSPNGGLNFTNIDPSPADFGELVWTGDTGYVATATGVKMTVDGGMSFSTVALAGQSVRKVAVAGNNMYAVVRNPAPVQDTVLYSTNAGSSFSAAPFSARFRFSTVQALLSTVSGVLVGSDYGLYGTANNGTGWGLADSGYHATKGRGLATSGAYIYAGAPPMGVFRVMPDSGALQWQHTGDRAHGVEGNINAIAAKGAYVHAAGATNYYRSSDSGATWTAGAIGASTGNISSVYASPVTSDVWIIRNGNLFYSSDDGGSFGQVVNSNIPLNQSQFVTRADTALFVATPFALYKGSTTMTFAAVSGLSGHVTAVAFAGGVFYAATDNSGLYSSANGAGWTAVSASPGTLPSKINTLIADSANLIAGTDNGVYSNAGSTWGQIALPDHVIQSLAVRAGKLFAGTCSGVYSVPYKIIAPPPATAIGQPREALNEVSAYPNPAAGRFFLHVQTLQPCSAEIVVRNSMGVVMLKRSVTLRGGVNELPVGIADHALSPGLYLVQLSTANDRATVTIILN